MTTRPTWSSADLRLPHPLRRHQREALDAVDRARASGTRRAWVVLPPGAGKTLVGLETARRLGRPTVVLSPNTAIQTQWADGWDELLPDPDHPARAGTARDLDAFLTSLTYQSLATFVPDDEVDEEGHEQSLLTRLHPNGAALVERLHAAPEITVVLDECHHLLEVWGQLLSEVLAELPQAFVLGLTATPPATLTPPQADLVDDLFGGILYEASIPAVVREGHLAPFAELAWLTTPSPREAEYVTGQAGRFAELVHGLTDPAFGSTGFLEWVDRRFCRATEGALDWHRLARGLPELTDAALRLHHHGLMRLPDGARVLEQHRRDPSAEDWVLLIDDWARHLRRSDAEEDRKVIEVIRRALPAVGYRWTRAGIRPGRSPVDRVLARSEAKTHALAEIVGLERRNLGDRLRMLVLCDHERASSLLPVDLRGVLPAEAGSAVLALERLVHDPTTSGLAPLLVTGSRVAGAPETLHRLRELVAEADPDLAGGLVVEDDDGVASLTGPWSSRDWVPWATRFFETGRSQVLIGTRALLGEGWDAPAVTGLVDLTTATTSTAVVQSRGRALRLDPAWPDKVAITWTVVCVTDAHPKGDADWQRFVRKHHGFFGVDEHGDVVDGVAHVHERFSPYHPPAQDEIDACNAAMAIRSESRDAIAERWRVGEPYDDAVVPTLRTVARRMSPPEPGDVLAPVGGRAPRGRAGAAGKRHDAVASALERRRGAGGCLLGAAARAPRSRGSRRRGRRGVDTGPRRRAPGSGASRRGCSATDGGAGGRCGRRRSPRRGPLSGGRGGGARGRRRRRGVPLRAAHGHGRGRRPFRHRARRGALADVGSSLRPAAIRGGTAAARARRPARGAPRSAASGRADRRGLALRADRPRRTGRDRPGLRGRMGPLGRRGRPRLHQQPGGRGSPRHAPRQ